MSSIRIIELVALAFSFLLLHPANDRKIRLLIPVMVITVIVETLGWHYHTHLHKANHIFYNISVPSIIILFLLLFRRNLVKSADKNITTGIVILFIAFCLLNIYGKNISIPFAQGFDKFCTYNYIGGTVALTIAGCIFLVQLIRKEDQINLLYHPVFWITLAIFTLYIPKSILYAVFEYLAYRKTLNESFGITFKFINTVLSIVFFSVLSYASLCRLIFRK